MKLRTLIVLGIVGVVAALGLAAALVLSALLERAARSELAADLQRAAAVFVDLHAYRESLHRSQAQVVAQEPRVKAVLGSEEISRETIVDGAHELQRSSGADLVLMVDPDGRLLVDTAAPQAAGFDLMGLPVVARALATGESAGVWTQDERVYQVAGRRVGIGEDSFGAIVLGYRYSGAVAETVYRQTGRVVALALDDRIVAASGADEAPGLLAALPAALPILPAGAHEAELGGHRVLLQRAPLPGYIGEQELTFIVIGSLDAALRTQAALQRAIAVLAAAALLLAGLLATAISRRLARPVDRLVDFTKQISLGRLDARAELAGPLEVTELAAAMNQMAAQLAASQLELAAKERLEQELEIAARIQTSILPRELEVPHFELAARMRPASEVGGDYYDVIQVQDGCWVGIGDVAGHGLTAGLVMMMVQCLVAVLVGQQPYADPSQLLPPLNRVIYGNVRQRLAQDEHVTLTLLRLSPDGRVRFSGAHEDLLVCRAIDGSCEQLPTPGTWLGVVDDVEAAMRDSELRLRPGDVLLLYTDGLTEATNAERQQFGLDRAAGILERLRERPAQEICDALFTAVDMFAAKQRDDITAVVIRYTG